MKSVLTVFALVALIASSTYLWSSNAGTQVAHACASSCDSPDTK